MLGHCDAHTSEQTQPEDPKKFAVITLDKIYDDGSYVFQNNNIFWDESVTGVWDQIDSVSAPDFVNPLIKKAVDADKVNAIYFSEPLIFAEMCSPQISYIALYYANPTAGTYPDSWCVGGDGGFFPDQINLAYSKTSKSYTASTDGKPVGNLNYFGDLGTSKNIFKADYSGVVKAYPNPFTQNVNISYNIEKAGLVKLSIYDLNGREVKNLINQNQSEGNYQISWDGRVADGTNVSTNMYIYRIETPSFSKSGSLRVVR